MTRHPARFPAFALSLALGACVVDPAAGPGGLPQLATRADELALGREEHPRILKQFGGAYERPGLGAYVDQVGQNLVKAALLPEVAFSFTVLNNPVVNAFALPGGFVYVTRGLLALAGNEAELASVLAHEIGHVAARHAAQRHQRAAAVAAKPSPKAAAGSAMTEGAQDQLAYVQGYSREQEAEADTLGIGYLARAGYDPGAMASFLGKLDAQAALEAELAGLPAGEANAMSFTATHPRTADRVRAAEALAGEIAGRPRALNEDAYLKQIDGILYGDDPDQGFVRGASFLHPKLRLRFDVPAGFRLFNSSSRVIARNAEEAVILFDQAPAPKTLGVADYLTQVWSRDLALGDVESIFVNGFAAATGWVRVETNRGQRDLRLVAIQFGADTIFRFTFITPPALTETLAVELRRATYSFRALSDDETAALRPLRLSVVGVREGESAATLAERMPMAERREALLRVLNGLKPEERLVPGRKVKLVAEE
ncbi:MAG: M48 family metalloprotease [Rhodospirillales bacterium]